MLRKSDILRRTVAGLSLVVFGLFALLPSGVCARQMMAGSNCCQTSSADETASACCHEHESCADEAEHHEQLCRVTLPMEDPAGNGHCVATPQYLAVPLEREAAQTSLTHMPVAVLPVAEAIFAGPQFTAPTAALARLHHAPFAPVEPRQSSCILRV